MNNPEYLGDSVYIVEDEGRIVIYLNNGMGEGNKIILEDEVALNLLEYLEKRLNDLKDHRTETK